MANELSYSPRSLRRVRVSWAPVACLALSASALLLQLIELNDVFLRHEWVTRQYTFNGGAGLVTTTMPPDPLPFLWPGADPQSVWVGPAVMVVVGLLAAVPALAGIRNSRWRPGPATAWARLAVAAGVAVGVVQLLYLFGGALLTPGESTCDTWRVLPWLELSALLGLVGAAVGLRSSPPVGRVAGSGAGQVARVSGIALGLGVAALTLASSIVIMFTVVGPNCPP